MGDTDVDYRSIEVPTDKAPAEYSYQERRADILQNYILDKGHPSLVNWSRLSRYYDKSKATLHNDKETLLEWIVEDVDATRVKGIGMSLFERGLLEISTDDDYDPFDEVAFYKKWITLLDDFGMIDLDEDEDPLFASSDESITVEIAGVAAEDVDLDDMPDRDKPDPDSDDEEVEEPEAEA